VWITVAAIAVGIVFLGLLVLANRSSDTMALTPPSDPTPTAQAAGRSVGSADAPATLDVWADFQCPSCGLFSTTTEARLNREYVADGRLRIVFHDFAFIGDESLDAAVAARAAGAQGQFWPYHDWLFANQAGENKGGFRREVLVAIAKELGLDVPTFEQALDDSTLADDVRTETASGSAVPVTATPTLVIGDQSFTGVPSWETLAAAIEAEIAKGGPATP